MRSDGGDRRMMEERRRMSVLCERWVWMVLGGKRGGMLNE